MKKIQCECGESIPACAMHLHAHGGFHHAAMNRKEALLGKEETHDISRIYGYDIAAYIAMGYEIVTDAFFRKGTKSMPGIFRDGVLHKKQENIRTKLKEYRRQKKIMAMREYRKEKREEILAAKKESWHRIKAQRQAKKAIAAMGKEGNDDRIRILYPLLVARAENGLIIRSQEEDRNGLPQIVQVVVKDSTTGLVHFLTIPPEFGKEKITDKEEARKAVHAAIAWTFGMNPEEYAPAIEA